MGIPVVATDLIEIRRFNDAHRSVEAGDGDIVAVAANTDQFVRAIGHALSAPGPGAVERRIDVARSNSWQQRIDRMSALIDDGVEGRSRDAGRWDVRLQRAYRTARRRALALVLLSPRHICWCSRRRWCGLPQSR